MFRVEEEGIKAKAMGKGGKTRKSVEYGGYKCNGGKFQMVICISNSVWIVL